MSDRFYVREGYWWEVWDKEGRVFPDGHKEPCKAVRVQGPPNCQCLYPADDFETRQAAENYAKKLNKLNP